MLVSRSKVSNLFRMVSFLFSAFLVAIFVTIVMVKVKLNEFFILGLLVYFNQLEAIGEKQFLFFGLLEEGVAK